MNVLKLTANKLLRRISFKLYLGEYSVYNFVKCILKESKYRIDVIKQNFNKELEMRKNDDEDFENYNKYRTCDNIYVDIDAKLREDTKTLHIEIVISRLN